MVVPLVVWQELEPPIDRVVVELYVAFRSNKPHSHNKTSHKYGTVCPNWFCEGRERNIVAIA